MNKNLKPLIIILVAFLCAVALIGCMYYEKTVQTFSPMFIKSKVVSMNENNAGYNELKKSLKEKYSNQFIEMLKGAKAEYTASAREVLGEEYVTLRDELIDIENQIRLRRHDFINSEEYLTAKTEMTKAKLKYDLSKPEEKEDNEKAFQNALSTVSTLNTKLNNQLKDLNQSQIFVKTKLIKLFDGKKSELLEIKKQTEQSTQKQIAKILYDYFVELKNLNLNFGVNANNQEMPFDDNLVKTFNIYTDFEKSYFNGNLETKNLAVNHDIVNDTNVILN